MRKGYWTYGSYMGYIPGKGYMQFENEEEYALYWQMALIANNSTYGAEGQYPPKVATTVPR